MFRRLLLTAVPLAAVAVVAMTFNNAEAIVAPKANQIVLNKGVQLLDKRLIPAPERDRLVTVPNRFDLVNKINKGQVVNRTDLVNKLNKTQVVHLQHKLDRIQRVQLANRVPVPVPVPKTPTPRPMPRPAPQP